MYDNYYHPMTMDKHLTMNIKNSTVYNFNLLVPHIVSGQAVSHIPSIIMAGGMYTIEFVGNSDMYGLIQYDRIDFDFNCSFNAYNGWVTKPSMRDKIQIMVQPPVDRMANKLMARYDIVDVHKSMHTNWY